MMQQLEVKFADSQATYYQRALKGIKQHCISTAAHRFFSLPYFIEGT
jgi:hypothetical protein